MARGTSLVGGALCVLALSTLVAFGMHTGDHDKPEHHAAPAAVEKQDAAAAAEPPAQEASQKMQKHHEEALAKRAAVSKPKTEQKVKDALDKSSLAEGIKTDADEADRSPPGTVSSGCEGEDKTCCTVEACNGGNVLKQNVETNTPCKGKECSPRFDDHTCCESKEASDKKAKNAEEKKPEEQTKEDETLDKAAKGK